MREKKKHYLRFDPYPTFTLPPIWGVIEEKTEDCIGTIYFSIDWRSFVFHSDDDKVLPPQYMDEITEFIAAKNISDAPKKRRKNASKSI